MVADVNGPKGVGSSRQVTLGSLRATRGIGAGRGVTRLAERVDLFGDDGFGGVVLRDRGSERTGQTFDRGADDDFLS